MSDPDLLWRLGWEPRACWGPRSATFRSRLPGARPSRLRARGGPGLGARMRGVARGRLGSGPRSALGGAWAGAAPRPARLRAPSPHSFVLARGSWRSRGPAAPPTRWGRVPVRRRAGGAGGPGPRSAGAPRLRRAEGGERRGAGEGGEGSRGGARGTRGEARGEARRATGQLWRPASCSSPVSC